MKTFSIYVILFCVLLSVNAFSKTITDYLDIYDINQLYSWLEENNFDELKGMFDTEFIPFVITEEGNQIILKKGSFIEGKNLKSTYKKEDDLFNFFKKDNLKYLSNKRIELEKDSFIVSTYDIDDKLTNEYIKDKNIEKSFVDHLQLITIERNERILWYTINETKTPSEEVVKSNVEIINPFKVLDFVVLDKDKVIFSYYKIGRNHWMRLAYLDVISFKDKTLVEQYVFPINLDSASSYTGKITNANILSDSIMKMNFSYNYLDKKELEFSVLWIYNYPINKDSLIRVSDLGNRSFDTNPKILWISDKENNMPLYNKLNFDDFYYDNILGDTEPTIDELKEKFPEDRFF